ncbi:MAG: hypothetical protein IRZ15_07550 [Bryobacteraceae bacterium]|nr:hypothetical protein [Bryobacteraceae bacterium]
MYEFLRNNALDARLPLDRTGRVADLRFNQFGGNIGGPVILPKISPSNNKKVFFFFNYEGTRASRPRGSNFRDLPHPDLLTGDLSRLLRPQRMQFAPNFNVGTVFQPGTITRDSAGRVTGGLPFPNNIVPRSMWSRNAEAFLRVIGSFPTAGGVVLPSSPELIRVPYQEIYRFYKNQYVARIDYSISPKANFFFRWVRDDQNEEQPTGIFTSAPFPVFPQFREKPGRSFSWNLINVISPSMTNEAIVTYNDLDQLVDVTPGTDPSMYDKDALGFRIQELYPQVNVRNRFPRFSCGVGDCNFSNFPANWRSEGTTYAFTDNFTVIRGSHTFKFGTFLNRNDNAQQPSWTDALNVSFSPSFINPNDTDQTFANMLLGNYTSINQSDGIYYGRFRFFGMEFYGQDSWKVNRRLTLELGARYVYLGPTYTLGEFLMYYFDPARYDPAQAVQIETARGATQGSIIPGSGDPFNGMVQEGSPGVPKGFSKHRWNQVSPRFGIAIDPFGDGKTSIRAGGGIFWERIRQNNLNFDGLGNPPLAFNPSIFAGNIDDVSPALLAGGVRFPQGIRAWSAEGKNPTIYSWSVNIQRQLPGQTSVDIGYIGNLGRHLMDVRDINQLPLGTTINTPILSDANGVANAVRPYRGYTSILFTDFGSNSNYNALQVRVSRRFSANLTFNMNYTWSKALGYTETDTEDIGYFLDRRRNYGPLDYDRTHVFNMDYVYLLPKFGTRIGHPAARLILDGWQISGITRFSSGRPLTVTLGGNPGTLGGGVRADYLGGDIFEGTGQISTANPMYFNPFRFARPPEGTLGNTANGIFRGPGINNWDMSLFKNTRISERVTAQLRFEFFNVFNHTQWDGINTSRTLPNPGPVTEATRGQLGEITSSRDPRNIQLGLKIYF